MCIRSTSPSPDSRSAIIRCSSSRKARPANPETTFRFALRSSNIPTTLSIIDEEVTRVLLLTQDVADPFYVRVRVDVLIAFCTCRARSVIQRTGAGPIVAIVGISPSGSPVEWIAHEFEHLLDQVDGL